MIDTQTKKKKESYVIDNVEHLVTHDSYSFWLKLELTASFFEIILYTDKS